MAKLLPKAALVSGVLLLLLSAGAGCYNFSLVFKYGNVASTPNWAPTVHPEGLDALIWRTPIYPFVLVAIVLIAVGVAKIRNKISN